MSAKIAVVGAGVIGLSSAYALKLANPNCDVTIFSEKFTPNVTSNGAAGILKFKVGAAGGMQDTPPELLAKWFTKSYNWCSEILKKDFSNEVGISRVSGYLLFDYEREVGLWEKLLPDGRHLNEKELKRFDPDIVCGSFGTSMMCEGKRYLPWLTRRFEELGGKILEQKVNSFPELHNYDVIVNCSGLGSRDLCKDSEMTAWRGQVIRMEAPWIKHFYHLTKTNSLPVYIYPGIDDVIVGGTYEPSEEMEVLEDVRKTILENAIQFEPSLKNAKIKYDWVGLRPARTSVRLEKEEIRYADSSGRNPSTVKVVHNYGHGPCGITLSWGCAQDAVALVQEFLLESRQSESEIQSKL